MKLNQGVHDEKSTTGCRWIVVKFVSLCVCVRVCVCAYSTTKWLHSSGY